MCGNPVKIAGDWRQPYLGFLKHRVLPNNHFDVMKIKRRPSVIEVSIKHFSSALQVMSDQSSQRSSCRVLLQAPGGNLGSTSILFI